MKDFPTYDTVSVNIINNSPNKYVTNSNEKYSIISIRGLIKYNEDFDSCIQKRDEIVEVLSVMFSNAQKKEYIFEHSADPSGDSIVDAVSFDLDSGSRVTVNCSNFEENFRIKNKQTEGLNVAIQSTEFISWFRDR